MDGFVFRFECISGNRKKVLYVISQMMYCGFHLPGWKRSIGMLESRVIRCVVAQKKLLRDHVTMISDGKDLGFPVKMLFRSHFQVASNDTKSLVLNSL